MDKWTAQPDGTIISSEQLTVLSTTPRLARVICAIHNIPWIGPILLTWRS